MRKIDSRILFSARDLVAFLTLRAMKSGAPVIHQAYLVSEPWVGVADFLLRVEVRSDLGSHS